MFSTWALSKEYGLSDVDGGRPDWGTFFPRKVQEIVDGDEPTEGNIFIVRTRLYQAELDPAADDEAGRLRTWLAVTTDQGPLQGRGRRRGDHA